MERFKLSGRNSGSSPWRASAEGEGPALAAAGCAASLRRGEVSPLTPSPNQDSDSGPHPGVAPFIHPSHRQFLDPTVHFPKPG